MASIVPRATIGPSEDDHLADSKVRGRPNRNSTWSSILGTAFLRLWRLGPPLFLLSYLALFTFRQAAPLLLNGLGGCRAVPSSVDTASLLKDNACVAVVGASSGIGKDLSDLLKERTRVKLALTGRTQERAERVAPDDPSALLLAHQLDLEDPLSVDAFADELRRAVQTECPDGRLQYSFLNAGLMYAPGYDEQYVSSTSVDSKTVDRLFAANFLGYTRLIRNLTPDVLHASTRVVFVTSVAHYVGEERDVLTPNLGDKTTMNERLRAYSTSKLALSAMQQVLAKEGRLPNSVLFTPGAVDTPIAIAPKSRASGGQSPYPWLLKQLDFSSKEGAHFLLRAGLLPQNATKIGELLQPYWYPFARSWHLRLIPRGFWRTRLILNTMNELFLQGITYSEAGWMWACPASEESRSEAFQKQLVQRYPA